jgi:hypothetical protein
MPISQIKISTTQNTASTASTATTPSIGVVPSEGEALVPFLSAKATRKGLSIANNSGTTIFLGFSASLTVANGIPLPDGVFFEMVPLYLGEVFAVTASGSAIIICTEFV